MSNREREFAALGLEYAEGIDRATIETIPATGREARKNERGKWEAVPWNGNAVMEFDDLLDAVRAATPPQKKLERQDSRDGKVTLEPLSCNMVLHCTYCDATIPAGEEYYDVQAWHGSAEACHRHTAEEIRKFEEIRKLFDD
jgi:hypothetical protein